MTPRGASTTRGPSALEVLRSEFRWSVPEHFNIGVACCDRHPVQAPALVEVRDRKPKTHTFGDLSTLSNRLANGLRTLGVKAGDRVAIALPQSLEAAVAHLAVYKLGGVVVPLTVSFGAQALGFRVADSGARILVTDSERLDAVESAGLTDLLLIVADDRHPLRPLLSFWEITDSASAVFEVAPTASDDPALIIYTSGTTGTPKGAVLAHRSLLGHLPGFELSHDVFPQAGDCFWTPADWAWIGGLMDALLPTWFHGLPVVAAQRGRFDPESALRLVEEAGVRNAFIPPTALKLMRQASVSLPKGTLRSVMSGGEPLGEEMLGWARDALGVTVNEIYGQTEANYVVGNSHTLLDVRPGSMGRPYPGHDVRVLDESNSEVPVGEVGEVAVALPDPVAFLGYHGRPDATREKLTSDGAWLRTGDLARVDAEGYLWFEARRDDVIGSAGYRIGPGEIEECLLHHPAVAMAAAIGVADEIRGQVVKAFVQLSPGYRGSPELEEELTSLVRTKLAPYQRPRFVEFVDDLPMTATGKIRRGALRELEAQRATK